MKPAAPPPPGFRRRWIDAGGARFHAIEGGAGDPVLLVGGWPQNWYVWRKLMPELALRHRVLAIDPPGLGDSDPATNGCDTASIARGFRDVIDTIGWQRCHFVGHDIGAWIGYAFAVRYPERLRSLALMEALIPGLGPAAIPHSSPASALRTWHFAFNALPELPELLITGRERAWLEWLFRTRTVVPMESDAIDEYERIYARAGGLTAGFAYYRAMFESAAQNAATSGTRLDMPVLAVGGAQWLGDAIGRAIESVTPRLATLVVPDCAHFPAEEAPDAVRTALIRFLDDASK